MTAGESKKIGYRQDTMTCRRTRLNFSRSSEDNEQTELTRIRREVLNTMHRWGTFPDHSNDEVCPCCPAYSHERHKYSWSSLLRRDIVEWIIRVERRRCEEERRFGDEDDADHWSESDDRFETSVRFFKNGESEETD